MVSSSDLCGWIRSQICSEIAVSHVQDAIYAVDVPLMFPDGDQCRVYLAAENDDQWSAFDGGSAVTRAAYAADVDVMGKGHVDRFQKIVKFHGLSEEAGQIKTSPQADVAEAVFAITQASIDIVNLAREPKEKKPKEKNRFSAKLQKIVTDAAGESEIESHWSDETLDPDGLYQVGFRVDPAGDRSDVLPLFVFEADTRGNCMHSTMSNLFYRNDFEFRSVAIYRDMDKISRLETERLNHLVDQSFPSIRDADGIRTYITDFVTA